MDIAVDMDSVDTPVWIIMDMDMEDQITRVDMDSGRKHLNKNIFLRNFNLSNSDIFKNKDTSNKVYKTV